MTDFVVYRLSDGKIEKGFNGDHFQLDGNVPEGCSALLGDDLEFKNRVNIAVTPHEVVEKTSIPFVVDKSTIVADGFDVAILSGLPIPTRVTPPEGESIDVTDGSIDIAIDLEGDWLFVLSSPLYLDTTVTITAS